MTRTEADGIARALVTAYLADDPEAGAEIMRGLSQTDVAMLVMIFARMLGESLEAVAMVTNRSPLAMWQEFCELSERTK